METPNPGEWWRHYRGTYYKILSTPIIESTELNIAVTGVIDPVFYQSSSDGRIWVRPVAEFTELVEIEDGAQVPRFVKDKYYEP